MNLRRVIYALLYELIAIAIVSPILAYVFDDELRTTFPLALVISLTALVWSYVFNTWFERWEAQHAGSLARGQTRSFWRRVAHGLGFEGGLVVILVPLMAWWLEISLLSAFLADFGLFLFFLLYSIVFTWVFDQLFD